MTLPFKNRIESISSTSSAPCRFTIPINISATDDYTIETDIRWLSYPDTLNIELNAYLSGNWYGVSNLGFYTITPTSTTRCSTDKFDNIRFVVQGNTTTLYVNGTQAISKSNQRSDITSIPLYWSTYAGTYYNMFVERKYFGLKVNGNYVHYYIPVLDNNDTPCFYDTVTNTLLYADAGYTPTVYGGVITETPSTYQRLKQLLIADKGILPYYCELESISYPVLFAYNMTVTATSVIEIETAIKYLGSIGGGNQLEGNSTAGRWYGIDDNGNYILGGGITSTTPASTTSFDVIKNVQNLATAIATLNVNGVDLLTRTGIAQSTSLTYGMFGIAGYRFNVAKKYHKVWVDGKLVYDYIPVLDYNGVACWYNRVDGQFLYADSGQNPTIWGREIHPIEKLNKERLRYWDLGALPIDPSDTIEMKFKRDDNTVNNILFRQTATIDNVETTILTCTVSNKYFAWSWFSATSSGNNFSTTLNEDIVDIKLNATEITVNGVTQTVSFTDNFVPDSDFYLFGLPTNSSKFYGDFYFFKGTSAGGKVKINIIPIVDETGTPYLWDSVGRTILTASGSGALTYDPIELDYVENTVVTNGAYTVIPYTSNENTEVIARFIKKNTNTCFIFGRGGGVARFELAWISGDDSGFRCYYGGNYSRIPYDRFDTVRFEKIKNKNILNSVVGPENPTATFTTLANFYIGTNNAPNGMVGDWNWVQVKENGIIFFNLIPAIKDGQIGLLDTLTNALYPSQQVGVPFVPHFLPQRKMFNALEGKTYWEFEIDTTLKSASNTTFDFGKQGTYNIITDWGDGTLEANGESHTYATAGKYTIRIYQNDTYMDCCRVGNQHSTCAMCVTKVNNAYPKTTIGNFANMFRGCTNLETIPENFFENNTHLVSIGNLFREATNFKYIPAKLLRGMNNLTTIDFLFPSTSVEVIPEGFFDDINKAGVTSLVALFSATKIKTLPTGLFAGFTGVTNCSQVLNQCSELESLPDYLFADMTKCGNYRYAIYNPPKLKINANLFCNDATDRATRFANVTSAVDFTGLFYRQTYEASAENGTAPELWNYTYASTPVLGNGPFVGAGNNTTSLTNYASIPNAWGGPA